MHFRELRRMSNLKDILIRIDVNGKAVKLKVKPYQTLLTILRDELELTGAKLGCGTGECGACTVIMDGKAVHSCLILAAQADGRKITTIEGISEGPKLHPLQEAFVKHGAIQCGFCTPGMILTAKAFLDEHEGTPTEKEIKEAFSGNICRCTGYVKILEAVLAVAKSTKKEDEL
jgi:carbon-monoxide dehydrogenase small subunit